MASVDWFPLVFFPLKIIVLGVGMFFSIKWHHDQAKKEKEELARTQRMIDEEGARQAESGR